MIASNFLKVINQKAEITPLNVEDIHNNDIVLKRNLWFQYNNAIFHIDILKKDNTDCLVT